MPLLSVIIVNYNVKYYLAQCLTSVLASKRNFELETIVVDNASSDGSQQLIRALFPSVSYIYNTDNRGFAVANNQAIDIARGEYLLLLNPDTVLGETVLQQVCNCFDNEPQTGAIGVKMLDGKGKFLPESKRGFPSPWVSFCKMSGLNALFPSSKLFGKYYLKYLDKNEPHSVDVLAGAFMALRRSAIDRAGKLDEKFFMYGEDIDLSVRIAKAGYINRYLPCAIIHYKGESTKSYAPKYIMAFYRAMYIFFKKHYPNYGLFFSVFITLGIVFSAVAGAFRRIIMALKPAKEKQPDTVFNTLQTSYSQIISDMEQQAKTGKIFAIYDKTTGMLISSDFVQKTAENNVA